MDLFNQKKIKNLEIKTDVLKDYLDTNIKTYDTIIETLNDKIDTLEEACAKLIIYVTKKHLENHSKECKCDKKFKKNKINKKSK